MGVLEPSRQHMDSPSDEETAGPSLPPRSMPLRTTAALEEARVSDEQEVQPLLPPRSAFRDDAHVKAIVPPVSIAGEVRPPVPPEAKSAGGKLATTNPANNIGKPPSIQLIDLEEEGERFRPNDTLTLVHPEPLPAWEDTDIASEGTAGKDHASLRPNTSTAVTGRRSPSPLNSVTAGFNKLRGGAPKVFRSVSEGTLQAIGNVQAEAPKAFQGFAKVAQKTFGDVQTGTGGARKSTQKVFANVSAGLQRTVNGIPVPKAFAQTGEDFSDLTKLALKRAGLCSRCAAMPLDACFDSQTQQEYLSWATPLSRVVLHASWCQMCRILLSMLCRDEHDPVMVPEVRSHIKQDWLRGAPFREWIAEGYLQRDDYWPFGRGETRHEGATQVLGPMAEYLKDSAKKRSLDVDLKNLTRPAAGRGPQQVKVEDLRRRLHASYRDGYKRGKEQATRYPVSCVVLITIPTARAATPGSLWVDLVGCSNKPGAEEQVISHFMLRAVKGGFTVTIQPDKPLSYGHVLDAQWIDLSMSKLWLAQCEVHHGKACSEHGVTLALEKPGFLRLVDIESMRIVVADAPKSCRYVALSYVWGGAQMVKLQYDNFEQLKEPGSLWKYLSSLPRTIVDAMEIVKSAGERYLWVDALCILQENSHESREQIANMDAVYGSALFTIVAAQGSDANSGLPGIRRSYFAEPEQSEQGRQVTQDVATVKADIKVIAPFSRDYAPSPASWIWSTRAWTFQERLLSRRLLVFANGEMVWHCRSAVAREDMPVEQSGYDDRSLLWLDLKPQHFGIGVDSHWKNGSLELTRHGITHVVRSAVFAEYAKMLPQYTQRTMTYESDAVNAIAGLLRIFSLCLQTPCIYGLPSTLLDVALLWRPDHSQPQGRPSTTHFPSWSWAGWRGRVRYGELIRMRRDETGQMIETEGIRPLLRYFVFDQKTGSLQPLNGTARGLPLTDDELPPEWEAHAPGTGCESATHSCRTPDTFDLDPRTIPVLADKHLVFWTSISDEFRLGDGDLTAGGPVTVLAPYGGAVGTAFFDAGRPVDDSTLCFMLLAEAHCSLLNGQRSENDYSDYLVMLVEIDGHTAIARRLGLGQIPKFAWDAADPTLQLVCLG